MFLGKTPPRTARIRYARDYFLFLSVTSVTCSSLVEEEEGRLGVSTQNASLLWEC